MSHYDWPAMKAPMSRYEIHANYLTGRHYVYDGVARLRWRVSLGSGWATYGRPAGAWRNLGGNTTGPIWWKP
jgi:hypothetical protein